MARLGGKRYGAPAVGRFTPWSRSHTCAAAGSILALAGCTNVATPPPQTPSVFDSAGAQGLLVPSYPVGSLLETRDSPEAGARQVDCVDIRVEAVRAKVDDTSIALAFRLGNRCAGAAHAAFGRARVRATWADGTERDLALFDPLSQVNPEILDGRAQALELLEYVTPRDAPAGAARAVCVDVSRIIGESPAPHVAPICLSSRGAFANVGTIVGHAHFDPEAWRRFRIHWLLEAGIAASYVDLQGVVANGSTSSHESFRFDMSRLRGTVTYGIDMRVSGWVSGPFYAGGVFTGSVGALPVLALTEASTPVQNDPSLGDFNFAALGGISTTGTGPVRLRFDVAAGVRLLVSELYPPGCSTDPCAWNGVVVRPLVTPRVVLDAWLSPWLSVAAWAQADALYLPDFGVGLSIAMHFWAYDGLP
jgi:hypothetical protein